MDDRRAVLALLPSVDRLLQHGTAESLIERWGRQATVDALRRELADLRRRLLSPGGDAAHADDAALLARAGARLDLEARPSLRPVFNLTGTVLHTNLGRAPLPPEAIAAIDATSRGAAALEFDLERGGRGDRDDHVARALCRLTGADAATVVNNNAAAVLLVLNTLALGRDVPTSRGELIEIGGSFRLPDIMRRAGCRLREVGTTNRVHLDDYAAAIGPRTGAVMKVHTSNYQIVGFTAGVPESQLAPLCHERGVPLIVDLGSGALVDLRQYGLPHEPTPGGALAAGADLVTFSGDKLLGGPQAGLIVGRADLIRRLNRNPLKRALRVDRLTLAALGAVLRLYEHPERLRERLPALRLLTRPLADIREMAGRLCATVAAAVEGRAVVRVIACDSEIGSGSLPTQRIESAGLALQPRQPRRGSGRALHGLAAAFRRLPIPVVGRIHDDAFVLDLRCLEEEEVFARQLGQLTWEGSDPAA